MAQGERQREMPVSGPLAIVTGATRGLGVAVARSLAAEGMAVVLTGRDAARAEALADEVRRVGGRVEAHPLDVTSDASVRALVQWLGGRSVGVLVNNAGVAMRSFDERVVAGTLAANFWGPVRVTDALVPALAPGARVVMVSSTMGQVSCLGAGLAERFTAPALERAELFALVEQFVSDVAAGKHARMGWPTSAYSVSKAALNAFTRIVARELPAQRVNAVCPGWVRTDMGGRSAPRSLEQGAASILWATRIVPTGPTGGFFRDGAPIAL